MLLVASVLISIQSMIGAYDAVVDESSPMTIAVDAADSTRCYESSVGGTRAIASGIPIELESSVYK